ncbi:MAG: type II secretion system minor pseudopilin GspK [Pseudomonadota bacterium]
MLSDHTSRTGVHHHRLLPDLATLTSPSSAVRPHSRRALRGSRTASFRSLRRSQGVALIIALLVAGIVATLVVAMSRDFNLNYRRSANAAIAEQTWLYLRGTEELAALALTIDHDADQASGAGSGEGRDDLTEVWAQPQEYPLDEGGFLSGFVIDLQGRFNLHTMIASDSPSDGGAQAATASEQYSESQRMFVRLLQSLPGIEVDEFEARAIADATIDWLDTDENPRLNGAESAFYGALDPAYRTPNMPITSVSELRAVSGMRPDIFESLQHFVTAWPQQASEINIHTATVPVLRTLNPDQGFTPLSEDQAMAIWERRRSQPFEDLEAFFQQELFVGGAGSQFRPLLTESSKSFLLASMVEIDDRQRHMYSWLSREGRLVRVLQRREATQTEFLVTEVLVKAELVAP